MKAIPAEVLRKKRDGAELSAEEIAAFIAGVTAGDINDAQAAAFLMAVCTRGMSAAETGALTIAMRDSGRRYRFPHGAPRIDKHSTGGVGDKLSLLIVPIVAACGVHVPMMSGRGLGHTGGTVDKLESVIGLRMGFDEEELSTLLSRNGCFMIKASTDIAPADRILYALRDVTGTVESSALITASILSKKLVEDIHGLVLDMKVGRGAFMQTMDAARDLAERMMGVATEVGLPLRILFTRMDQPLGSAVGNWVEMAETDACLRTYQEAPSDLAYLSELFACRMLMLARPGLQEVAAMAEVREAWSSGAAYRVFHAMLEAQGGRWQESVTSYADTPFRTLEADRDGFITGFATRESGLAAITLGAGRVKQDDVIDPSAGFVLQKKTGDEVARGEPLLRVYARDERKLVEGLEAIRKCVEIGPEPPSPAPMLLDEWSNA
ncbi:MAG: thymidine phosphorylase [Candidatus Kapaibacterium sp.]